MLKNFVKKTISLTVVLLLVLSFNFVSTSNAGSVQNNTDGVWYDDFSDDTSISQVKDCELDDGVYRLEQGSEKIVYDMAKTPDSVSGWYKDSAFYAREEGGLMDQISQFVPPNLSPGMPFSDYDDEDIELRDGERVVTESYVFQYFDYTFYPTHHFQFSIEEDIDNVEKIEFSWWFGKYENDANLEDLKMFLWSYNELLPHWQLVDETGYDSSNITNSASPDLSFSDLDKNFVSDEGIVDILIVGSPDKHGTSGNETFNAFIYSDYVKAEVETKEGYLLDGYIISDEINAGSLERWESVVWESSRPGGLSFVEVSVLDEDGDLISNDYQSVNSPMDISDLDPSQYGKIKLRAFFNTSQFDITASLFSWGVTWQTSADRYRDLFSSDLRVDKVEGAEKVANSFYVDENYGDWSIFGKNPDNSRYYIGEGLKDKPSGYQWYSQKDLVGGGFRSPVISNNKLYIGSDSGRIFCYDITYDDKNKTQYPIDYSSANFSVDSSLAVSDGKVILGTSRLSSPNKIYALNADDLSEVIWEYSEISSGSICYSSSPTVANNKVFVTSWNGNLWDIPVASMMYKLLGGNNKLVALDLKSGEPVWESIDLPAGSFSTPAVGDGMVFVGCDNIYGDNLFAFNEDTGEEIWNTSVGTIGKSNPLYSDGKLFIVCRDRNISTLGDSKVMALDADTGQLLWSKTISGSSLRGLSFVRSNQLYELLLSLSPVSSPALYENNLLVVMSPDGNLYGFNTADGSRKWVFDTESGVLESGFTASPLIAGNKIYIVSFYGNLYSINAGTGKKIWNTELKQPGKIYPSPGTYVIGSPVFANGMLFINSNENFETNTGRLYCMGKYTENNAGLILSKPIYVPYGNWWDVFSANFDSTYNNTLSFSVFDEDYNLITNGLNGSDNDVSSIITSNVIRLGADLFIGNSSETLPYLNSWTISWKDENTYPVIYNDSFSPIISGFVSDPRFSVKVTDEESGIDKERAKYKIRYNTQAGGSYSWSDWKTCSCSDRQADDNYTVTADTSSDFDLTNIYKISKMSFYVEDLAGHSVNETIEGLNIKFDISKPSSQIDNIQDLTSTKYFNDVLTVEASGEDDKSSIKSLTLQYKYSDDQQDWGNWFDYDTANSNTVTWSYQPINDGYYKLRTIAEDEAGNTENTQKQGTDTIVYDTQAPELNTNLNAGGYQIEELDSLSIVFTDNIMLKTLSYRLNIETSWDTIVTNINSDTYTLQASFWDELDVENIDIIFFKITDKAGNVYITDSMESVKIQHAEEEIINPTLDLSDFEGLQTDSTFTIGADIPDDVDVLSAGLYFRYSTDKDDWSEWQQFDTNKTIAPYEWKFTSPEGDGYYEFYTTFMDSQGNIHTSSKEMVKVGVFPVIPVVILIVLIIALAIITIYLLIRMRKSKLEV